MSSQITAEPRRSVPQRVGPQAGDADRGALRMKHQVALVTGEREGTGLDAQPGGTYGFTYAPALPNAPVFQRQSYRAFEVHKRPDGERFIVGFVTPDVAARLASGAEIEIQLLPDADGDARVVVAVAHARIRRHRQYTVHTEPGVFLHLLAGETVS